MQSVRVTGKLVNGDDEPLAGAAIHFIPSKIWVEEDGNAYPTPAPVLHLDEDGEFVTELVRTDQHGPTWYYTVVCPHAKWTIFIDSDGPLKLKNLVPKRYTA